ncbi:MAG: MTH1187 family thiamine-binding protein [Deltaproteobacteria bacterium]|nr:MTH1187 family thiamine-binding protein [Deltaproteobacteria bacterium]
MSTIVEFSIFPLDKGESLSPYVARALELIQDSGLPYELNPMGTCVEGEWNDVMALVNRCFEALEKDCNRISLSLKADYRKGPAGRMKSKVVSVREKLK